ncbi:puromycin-sensitive aminopeptidase [Selaginella moellendorffii]|uniref:puromycin-sensitive aminopeptidase n=1 Tax=Selaginella moellendorffii TaxID=88036 RepID=UPI000D1CC3CD|nr:puromycin-sensitive aminopeptidase [Selaginella moellendorffii]|eukprot:XP_024516518.1 puromycin-sensitive aminopeptidase [Selaginella moellendorffii]
MKFLSDYRAPDYTFDFVSLLITTPQFPTRFLQSVPLVLDGSNLKLVYVKINGLEAQDVELTSSNLTLLAPPKNPFRLEIVTEIYPLQKLNNDECESAGFSKITFYQVWNIICKVARTISNKISQDRPDVLAKFTNNDKHYSVWSDPFPKPCYLFALVAGKFEARQDKFTTRSGQLVKLNIWSPSEDVAKTEFAMAVLKSAMKWDEDGCHGKQKLKCTSHFWSIPFSSLQSHASRVTCRDWFQISLKEGLTDFRELEFLSDMGCRSVRTIAAASSLRKRQFQEVDNLYTATCEDFYQAMCDANLDDLSSFMLWQETAPTPGQADKSPLLIPLAVGLLNSQGRDIPLSRVLVDGIESSPTVEHNESTGAITALLRVEQVIFVEKTYYQHARLFSFQGGMLAKGLPKEFVALVITLPDDKELLEMTEVADPDACHFVRRFLIKCLATELKQDFMRVSFADYLASLNDQETLELACEELDNATNLTDLLGALSAISQNPGQEREKILASFYEKWKHERLVSALLGGFFSCIVNFHAKDGSGYEFMADFVIEVGKFHPKQICGGLMPSDKRWPR